MNIANKLFLSVILFILFSNIAQAVTLEGQIYDYQLNELNNVLVEINTVPSQQFLSLDGTYSFELDEGQYVLKASKEDLVTEENIIVESDDKEKFLYDLFLFPSMVDEDDLWDDLGDIEDDNTKDSRTWAYVITTIIFLIAFIRIFKAKKKYKRKKGDKKGPKNEVHNEQNTSIRVELEEDPEIKISKVSDPVVSEDKDTDSEIIVPKENDKKFTKEEALASMDEEQPGYIIRTLDIIKNNDGRITQKELRKELMELSESKVSLILTELEHTGKIEKVKRGRGNVILLKEKLKD